MKVPPRLQTLLAEGLIDSVVRQLKSGKEADVYVVHAGGETCAAKVYKEAHKRSFRQAVDYTENRKVRNSRQARAMSKRTTFGRQQQEARGRAPKSTPCIAWPPPACACHGRTTSTTACC
jgi:RIO kinase 1